MMRIIGIFICLLTFSIQTNAQTVKVLNMEERAKVRDQWLKERFETIMPRLMKREGIDMWVLISREYNEDPVLKTMLPANWLAARRTTMLVIYLDDDKVETLACARYDVGEVFKKAWNKEKEPDQWKRLSEIIKERNPNKIAVNKSAHFGLADGISATHYEQLMSVLSKKEQAKVVSGERLALGWLETRTESEMVVYRQIMRLAHQIIAEGLSEKVIQPGVTTTDDVVWYYRQRIRELGVVAWFHPTVDIQRADPENNENQRSFSSRPDKAVIQPGDLIHIDFGITYLGLNTDTQQNAYVLKPRETEAPAYLVEAHQKGLQLMDILTNEFKEGRTGNEILASCIEKAKAEGLKPQIYTHPIGYHGHGGGPTIGLWDQQEGVPHKGDYLLHPNTAYSIEFNTKVFIKEWNKEIRMMIEEDAFFDENGVYYIDGRQTELYLIPRM